MSDNFPSELTVTFLDDKVKYAVDELSTNWLHPNDAFKDRISKSSINRYCPVKHLKKEIIIKNTLDESKGFLDDGKYMKAISGFDEVLFYDPEYGEALLFKSYALKALGHFVKSLRYYKCAVKADLSLKDNDYYRQLLDAANDERGNFPKLKLNIYAGDEYFTKGDFNRAVEYYNRALLNPSKFKDKILFKLLNKKATALVELERFDEALKCYDESLKVKDNDYAYFGKGLCEFKLDLPLNMKFFKRLDVGKNHLLKQVVILNKLHYFDDANLICDYLVENHFKVDEYYMELFENKIISLRGLNKDYSRISDFK